MGLALFEPTNGAIRVSSVPLSVRNCYPLNSLPAGVRLPPDFKVTHAARCTFAFLGFVYNRVVVLSEITRSGAGIFTRTIWFAIDSDGQPMRAFYLDYLGIVLLPAYLLLSEWRFSRTFGKDLLGVRVRSLNGGALTIVQAVKRLLVRSIPLLIMAPALFLPHLMHPTGLFPGILALYGVGGVAAVVLLVNFIIAVRRGDLPWHDRWAKTEVVRGR
jgi:uncharacterized RDD family membrane protein YckC